MTYSLFKTFILCFLLVSALAFFGWALSDDRGRTPATPTTTAVAPSKSARACWIEANKDGSSDRYCGEVNSAPANAFGFSDRVPQEDETAWDCHADGNKNCGPGVNVDTNRMGR